MVAVRWAARKQGTGGTSLRPATWRRPAACFRQPVP
jgi:hypothetical protein